MAYKYNQKFGFGRAIAWKEGVVTKNFTGPVKLLTWIKNYRQVNGGDLRPDWDVRVLNKVCEENNLKGCVETTQEGVRKITLNDVSRFYRAMMSWKAHSGEKVSQFEAERRAKICASCPNNVSIVGCFGCQNVLPALMKSIGRASTSYDEQLNGCAVCGCVLKAKVHLPEGVMIASAKETDLYPDHCWIKPMLD